MALLLGTPIATVTAVESTMSATPAAMNGKAGLRRSFHVSAKSASHARNAVMPSIGIAGS